MYVDSFLKKKKGGKGIKAFYLYNCDICGFELGNEGSGYFCY